ncbi:phenylacetate--CoA ligase family protein [Heyndrickxia acidiproducens]|uniref:phenylacetate--CoA ligase family protein n=1 Tax=Heyndrickxia acidiproducens TaxID=1121084 RepID=UPI00036E686C|nr:AMP-binding protein [Heyndrickxia acidiproducens]
MLKDQKFLDAALKSPFYQRFLKDKKITDWNSIPFTTKVHLRNADAFDLMGVPAGEIATYHETSGTTGTPTPSWYSYKDAEKEAEVVVNSSIQLNRDDLILNHFPFAMAIPSFIVYWACQKTHAGHIGADKASSVTPEKRIVEIMDRTHPTILAMLPSEAEKIHQTAKQLGYSFPQKSLRALLLAGELVSPARKKYIEKMWGVPVYLLFGSTETGGLFMSCEHGHYHLSNPNVKVEAVNQMGQPVENGNKGNCVLSTMREGMPLLRYFNNDLIEIKDGSCCQCHNQDPIMIHYGRNDDVVHYGNEIKSFYDFQEAIYSLSSVPFMWKAKIEQEKITLRLQYVQAIKSESIKAELISRLGIPVSVEFHDIIPLAKLVEVPAYSKYAYIEIP